MRGIRSMRRILSAALVVGAAATACAVPAEAAKGGGGSSKAGFYASSGWTSECDDGAACTGSASAARTGRQVTSSSVSRSDVHPDEGEWAWAWARGLSRLDLPNGAASITLTAKWRVDRAVARADLASSEGVATTEIKGDVELLGCESCVETDPSPYGIGARIVEASSSASNAGLPDSASATPGTIVTHTVVVRGPSGGRIPAGPYWVSAQSDVFSFVGCIHDTTAQVHLGEGSCIYPMLAGHSGTASGEADLTLLSIETTVAG